MKKINQILLTLTVTLLAFLSLSFCANAQETEKTGEITYKIYPETQIMIISGEQCACPF